MQKTTGHTLAHALVLVFYKKIKVMKNVLRILGAFLLLASMVLVSSCSRDDDPVDNDFFAGTYKGKISYNDGTSTLSADNGSVFVTKIASGTKYNFAFSNNIPNLNDVQFEKKGDHTLVSVGSSEVSYIRIDNNDLRILFLKDGKTWTATCSR